MPHPLTKTLLGLTLLALAVARAPCAHADGGEWTVDLKSSDQEKISRDVEGNTLAERTRERSLDIAWKAPLQPTLDMDYKFNFSRSVNESSDDFDSYEDSVTTEVALKAQWWEFNLGFDETNTHSGDPENDYETTHTLDGELKITPEYEDLPEFSFKFESSLDSDSQNYTANMEYEMLDIFTLKFEANKDVTDDTGVATDNTDARKFKGEASLSLDFWSHWIFETTATHTRDQQLTIDNGGYLLEKSDSVNNDYSAKLSNNPLDWIEYSVEYKMTEDKDLIEDVPVSRTGDVKNTIKLTPELTNAIKLELGFSNDVEDTSGTDSASRNSTNEYNFKTTYEGLDIFTLDFSYDRKDSKENPKSAEESTATTRDDSYKGTLDFGVWDDQIAVKTEKEYKYSWENSKQSANEDTWNFEVSVAPENIPNLEITPKYNVKEDTDRIEGTTNRENSLDTQVVYTVSLGDVTELKLDHAYKRTGTSPGDGTPSTIKREDTSKFSLAFKDFLQGMSLEGTWERNATDESLDDVGPEINFKYTVTYDWEILKNYNLTLDYEFSDNQESADEQGFKAEIGGNLFKDAIELKASYERNEKYGADASLDQTYLIEVGGKI